MDATYGRLRRSVHLRWPAFTALVLSEWMLLGLRFDTPPLPDAWWALLVRHASLVMPIGTAVVTATLLLGRERLGREIVRLAAGPLEPRRMWSLVVAHLAAFALFFRTTAFVLEGGFRDSTVPGFWLGCWLLNGVVTAGLLIAAVAPRATAVVALQRTAGPLAVLAAVAVTALLAGKLADQAWYPLGHWTLSAVHALLRPFVDDPIARPTDMVVGTDHFLVRIEPPCSGYQGMGLIAVFLAVYLWLFRRTFRFPRALLLLPVAMVVAWCLNALRIAALVLVGAWLSPTIAVGGFHSYSGALLFCALALGLAAIANRVPWLLADPHSAADETEHDNPAAPLLVPFLVLVATGMATGAFSPGAFDAWYGVRVAAVAAALLVYRRGYGTLAWRWSWVAPAAGAAAFALWLAHAPETAHAETGIRDGLTALGRGWSGAWIGVRVFGAVVTAPIAEELAFRGYLLRRLIATDFEQVAPRRFTWLSFIGSSLLFGAMHRALVAGTLAGAIYALALYRRGRLSDAIVAHATTNALVAGYVLATGSWSLWS